MRGAEQPGGWGGDTRDEPLRVCVDLRALADTSYTAIRLLLVGDLLRRTQKLCGNRALVVQLTESHRPGVRSGWLPELSILDPVVTVGSRAEAMNALGGSPDVIVRSATSSPGTSLSDRGRAPRMITVGDVELMPTSLSGTGPVADDPLILRLALLRVAHAEDVVLTTARLHRAEETLQRWRFKVAQWARLPAASLPPSFRITRSELLDQLSISTVLTQLHRWETDPHLPSGSKFAAFVSLDPVLGLDLGRLIGKLHG